MSVQRYISTSFWDDEWIQSLDPSEKFLYLYLLTNPLTNIAGVYKISIRRICFDTGFNSDTVKHILGKFQKAKKAYHYQEYIVLPTWPKHQRWQDKPTIKSGIDKLLSELPENVNKYLKSVNYSYPTYTVSIPYGYQPSYSDSNIDTDTDSDISVKQPKIKTARNEYGKEKNVMLSDAEYQSLLTDLGEKLLGEMIEELSEGKALHGYIYKRDDLAIRKWLKKGNEKKLIFRLRFC